jgi:tetratricopeptide (TPR) repeat protein
VTNRLIVDLAENGTARICQAVSGEPLVTGDPVPFVWPLDADTIEDLRWYLEDYLLAPFAVYEGRGTRIEAELPGWGESLFASVFGSGAARDAYLRLRQRGDVELVLRSDSPSVLGLPWELMADPSRSAPLAIDIDSVSRSLLMPADAAADVPVSDGRFRVLMVISRPSGTGDIGYRMVARPLLERLEAVRGSVDLVVLRPPTLRALSDELDIAAQAGRPYQVVHFDGHGAFIGARDRTGAEGTLAFERPEGGAHYVPAAEIARVVNAAKVPVVVLNACESGAVGKELEAAVATRLLGEGTASVVAMAYSVHAVAAAEFMAAFYEKLFAGASVASAVTAGRQQMFARPERPCSKGRVPLRDWMVPVHYFRREVRFPSAAADAGCEGLDTLPEHTATPAGPPSGELDAVDGVFVGRDSLFYQLEQAARIQRVVVLAGAGGSGKTELAKAFGRWWRDTGGVDQPDWVFWHSFEPGLANLAMDRVIDEMAMALGGADLAALDAGQRRAVVQEKLRDHRMLLIWDGFESLHTMRGRAHAVHALDERGRAELREFLEDLIEHGNSVVLITSRTSEEWLGEVGRVGVKGLAKQEAAEYADTLLADYPRARDRRARRAFGDLMEWLDGHPLSMRLILPRLDTVDPEVLLAGLRGTVPLARAGDLEAEGWSRSLWAGITYSYAHLSQAAQRLLHAISLFQAVADWSLLSLLSDPGALAEFPEIPPRFTDAADRDWEAAFSEAARVGLVTRVRGSVSIYEVHPALPAFLAAAWRAEEPGRYEEQRAAATGALARVQASACLYFLQEMESDDVLIALGTIAMQRYTMGSLLSFALDHKQWDDAQLILRALNEFWKHTGLDAEFDPWAARVIDMAEGPDGTPPAADTEAGDLWLFVAQRQANRFLTSRRLDEAESLYLKILAAEQSIDSPVGGQNTASTFRQLGRVATARGNADEAAEWYRKASQAEEGNGGGDGRDGELSVARHYRHLGSAAFDRGNFNEAREWHCKALVIREEAGDRVGIAESYHDLGLAAEHQGDLDDAVGWYRKELGVLASLVSPLRMADAYSQLGNVALRKSQLKEAEKWHREALAIREGFGDRQGAGACYGNLGIIAHRNHRFTEAEDWYRQALAIAEEYASPERIASSCHALGMLAQTRGQLENAAKWYSRALKQDTGNPEGHVLTYGQLGLLAEKRNEPLEALEWMIKCVSKFDEFPHPATGPAPEHLTRIVAGWGRDGMDLLDWWWEEVTGNPLPDSVRTYVRAGILRRRKNDRRRGR